MQLLLVEDDSIIAGQIIHVLAPHDWQITHVQSRAAALTHLQSTPADIIIMDRGLPDGDGIGLLKTLQRLKLEVPVLILSALGGTESRIEGLNAGADDYLTKPFDDGELLARVSALSRRSRMTAQPEIRVLGPLELSVSARTAHLDGNHIPLSPKEFDLLKYFLDHSGDVVTRDMLLRDVWGFDFNPGTNVVDVNIGRLRRKLDRNGKENPLRTRRGVGFCLDFDA